MGARYFFDIDCPQCGNKVEIYDAPSSLTHVGICECGWKDPRDYYEIDEHMVVLCTEEELEEMKRKNPEIKRFRDRLEREIEEIEERNRKAGYYD